MFYAIGRSVPGQTIQYLTKRTLDLKARIKVTNNLNEVTHFADRDMCGFACTLAVLGNICGHDDWKIIMIEP
mgnify:CR=1 FL=1